MTIRNLFLSMMFISFWTLSLPVVAASPTPKEQVKMTVNAVLELLRDKSLDRQTRRSKIRAVINERFDYRAMSQRTLATQWRKVSDKERDRFVDLFSKLLEWTYVGRIEAYTNETVEFSKEIIKGHRAQVNTFIVTASADIPVNYRLLKKDNDWYVYDVIIEEVSLIRNYRSTYRSIVKNEGINGLLSKMDQKIKELKRKAESRDQRT
jgi:phospholipid transport system substrate-binding protein